MDVGRDPIRRRHHLPHWQAGGSYYWITVRSVRTEMPPIARQIVLSTLRHGHGARFDLIGAVAMPDHWHCVMCPLPSEPGRWYDLSAIMKAVKGASARRINQALGTSGQVWFPESYDHIIRDEDEYWRFLTYLVHNPVRRELVARPEEYEFTVWPGETPGIP